MSWLKHLIKKKLDKLESDPPPGPRPHRAREKAPEVSEQNLKEIREKVEEVSVASNKLNSDDKTEVIRLIALYKKDGEIKRLMKEERGIEIHANAIKWYRSSPIYKSVIQKARQDFESRISDVEFSSKRRRLEELSDIFWVLKDGGKSKSASEVMHLIQQMMEPNKKAENEFNVNFNQFNGMSDDELKHRMRENIITLETIKPKEIVVESTPSENPS